MLTDKGLPEQEWSMPSRAEKAWQTAAQCARLAQQADGTDEREFYLRMRNAWITVANRCEFIDVMEEQGAAPPERLPGRDAPSLDHRSN
jgi:hypothetical protein